MRHITFTICLLLCTFLTVQAKDKVITRPPFVAWSSNSIEIDKLVISDTATVAYIKAFYRPKYWIKIAQGSFLKDNNGQTYPIRRGIGITLDEKFWMPESGEAEFQLIFPPLPKAVTSVDFSEGDADGAFNIWGIQLDEKAFDSAKLPQGVVVPKTDRKMMLPEPTLQLGKAVLKGKILGYQPEMFQKGELDRRGVIRSLSDEEEIEIKQDGSFYKEVEVCTVTPSFLFLPSLKGISLLLAPGETTSVTIQLSELFRRQSNLHRSGKPYGKEVYFGGYLAGLQQELYENATQSDFYENSYNEFLKEIYGKTPTEYKAYILDKLSKQKQQIEQLSCSPACKEVLTIGAEFNTANRLMQTEGMLKNAHVNANKLDREAARVYYETSMEIPQELYADIYQKLPALTSSKAYYTPQLVRFIGNISSTAYMKKIQQAGSGTDKGRLFDDVKAFQMAASIGEFSVLTDTQKAEITNLPTAYANLLQAMNNNLLKKIELNKKKTGFTVNETGEVSNEDLFASILSKFSGKTLLVDFWTTWCGPCRMANKAMIPMKEELKDKEIVYLYITGETSPMDIWQNMIPDIHGEHFRVTAEQWKFLMSHFDIKGVPTYFVIDRKGDVTYKSSGFSGANVLKAKLLDACK